MNIPRKLQIHRFRDTVAIAALGIDGETIYLPKLAAMELAALLLTAAADIDRNKFRYSDFGTHYIEPRSPHDS